tara:strand:- start:757 stop:1647 length:891 start_codon:yes stop_codon:yes gene_type:complete
VVLVDIKIVSERPRVNIVQRDMVHPALLRQNANFVWPVHPPMAINAINVGTARRTLYSTLPVYVQIVQRDIYQHLYRVSVNHTQNILIPVNITQLTACTLMAPSPTTDGATAAILLYARQVQACTATSPPKLATKDPLSTALIPTASLKTLSTASAVTKTARQLQARTAGHELWTVSCTAAAAMYPLSTALPTASLWAHASAIPTASTVTPNAATVSYEFWLMGGDCEVKACTATSPPKLATSDPLSTALILTAPLQTLSTASAVTKTARQLQACTARRNPGGEVNGAPIILQLQR